MIVLRQKEYVSIEEKEAKMKLAHGILEAEENGDSKTARRLKRQFKKKDRKLATGLGAAGGAAYGTTLGLANPALGVIGAGVGAGIGSAVGHNIGRHISNDRYNRYMKAARKERYGYSDDDE